MKDPDDSVSQRVAMVNGAQRHHFRDNSLRATQAFSSRKKIVREIFAHICHKSGVWQGRGRSNAASVL